MHDGSLADIWPTKIVFLSPPSNWARHLMAKSQNCGKKSVGHNPLKIIVLIIEPKKPHPKSPDPNTHMYGGGVCTVGVFVCECKNCQGLVNSKTTPTTTESKIRKEKKSSVWQDGWLSESLFEWLVDWGVGVQGGGTIVHELGGVVRSDGAEIAAVWRVGQTGHHCHHLGYLLLQLRNLLLPLVDLAWMRQGEERRWCTVASI